MDSTIQIQIKSIYGKETAYPVCDKAHIFARLTGNTTLTRHALRGIAALGYTVQIVQIGSFKTTDKQRGY